MTSRAAILLCCVALLGAADLVIASPVATPATIQTKTTRLTVATTGGTAPVVYTWSASPATVTFSSANGTATGKVCTATFATPGSYSCTVTATDAANQSVSSSVDVRVDQVLTALALTPSTTVVNQGTAVPFAIISKDQFGVALDPQPAVTWTATGTGTVTVNAAGLFTAGATPGAATVTATVGVKSISRTLRVNVAPTVAAAVATATTTITGTTAVFTAAGADDMPVDELLYTWSAVGPKGVPFAPRSSVTGETTTATFAAIGAYTVTVVISDKQGLSATSQLGVTVLPIATSLSIAPTTAVVVNPGLTKPFVATARDQFKAIMVPQPAVAWAITAGTGSVGSDAIYLAGAPGLATVTVSSGAATGSVAVRVNATPTVATPVTTTTPTITSTTALFTVQGADDDNVDLLSYSWTATGPKAVAFIPRSGITAESTTATFTAAGTYTITAMITDRQGLQTTSSLQVTVQQTHSSHALNATTTVLNPKAAKVFAVQARDQFAAVIGGAFIPSVTWSAVGGTIDAAGRFVAGLTPGDATVTAAIATDPPSTLTAAIRINAAPTVTEVPGTTGPNPTVAATIPLRVYGTDDGGAANLRYTWSATGTLASGVVFSGATQNTNAARAITATVPGPGVYAFRALIRDAQGLRLTADASVEVIFPAPTINPSGGSFTAPVTITLGKAQPDGDIRYVVNAAGSTPRDPTGDDAVPTGPITLDASATVTARVIRAGWTPGPVATASYVIDSGTGGGGEPPSAPVVTLEIVGGLTGDEHGTWQGDQVAFTKSATVTVRALAASNGVVDAVVITTSQGQSVTVAPGADASVPLPDEGRVEISASAVARRAGLETSGATEATTVVLVDRTMPNMTAIIGHEPLAPTSLTCLNGMLEPQNATLRMSMGWRVYGVADSGLRIEGQDVSGLAVPPVVVFMPQHGSDIVLPLKADGESWLVSDMRALGESCATDGPGLFKQSSGAPGVWAMHVKAIDRCGNMGASTTLGRLWMQTVTPTAKLGFISNSSNLPDHISVSSDGRTDLSPVMMIVTASDVVAVWQGVSPCQRLSSSPPEMSDLPGAAPVAWRLAHPVPMPARTDPFMPVSENIAVNLMDVAGNRVDATVSVQWNPALYGGAVTDDRYDLNAQSSQRQTSSGYYRDLFRFDPTGWAGDTIRPWNLTTTISQVTRLTPQPAVVPVFESLLRGQGFAVVHGEYDLDQRESYVAASGVAWKESEVAVEALISGGGNGVSPYASLGFDNLSHRALDGMAEYLSDREGCIAAFNGWDITSQGARYDRGTRIRWLGIYGMEVQWSAPILDRDARATPVWWHGWTDRPQVVAAHASWRTPTVALAYLNPSEIRPGASSWQARIESVVDGRIGWTGVASPAEQGSRLVGGIGDDRAAGAGFRRIQLQGDGGTVTSTSVGLRPTTLPLPGGSQHSYFNNTGGLFLNDATGSVLVGVGMPFPSAATLIDLVTTRSPGPDQTVGPLRSYAGFHQVNRVLVDNDVVVLADQMHVRIRGGFQRYLPAVSAVSAQVSLHEPATWTATAARLTPALGNLPIPVAQRGPVIAAYAALAQAMLAVETDLGTDWTVISSAGAALGDDPAQEQELARDAVRYEAARWQAMASIAVGWAGGSPTSALAALTTRLQHTPWDAAWAETAADLPTVTAAVASWRSASALAAADPTGSTLAAQPWLAQREVLNRQATSLRLTLTAHAACMDASRQLLVAIAARVDALPQLSFPPSLVPLGPWVDHLLADINQNREQAQMPTFSIHNMTDLTAWADSHRDLPWDEREAAYQSRLAQMAAWETAANAMVIPMQWLKTDLILQASGLVVTATAGRSTIGAMSAARSSVMRPAGKTSLSQHHGMTVTGTRLTTDGPNAPLCQTLTIDLAAYPATGVGLYDISISCGDVHAYPDELSQQYAGGNGAHRMKEALKVFKPDVVPTVPKFAECLKKRSGKADEPVIIMTSGGDKSVSDCSLVGTEEGDKNVWSFTAKYDSPVVVGETGVTYAVVWDLGGGQVTTGSAGSGQTGGTPTVTVKYHAGQYKPTLKVYRTYNNQTTLVGTAAIHTINVYSQSVDGTAWTVTPVADDDKYGSETKLERILDEGVGVNVHVGVDVKAQGACRARISPDGYPQNEYWLTSGDSGDLPQPYAFKPESTTKGWTQGYGDPSAAIDDLSVRIKASKNYGGDTTDAKFTTVLVEAGVDASRDQHITFDGADRTSVVNPYRFWLNSNHDARIRTKFWPKYNYEEEDEVDDGIADSADGIISCQRDLQDFTRLWIAVSNKGVMGARLLQSDTSVEFRVRRISMTPSIRVFLAADPSGGLGHLTDYDGAGRQQSIDGGQVKFSSSATSVVGSGYVTMTIQGGTLASSWLTDANTADANRRVLALLVEGVTGGVGEIEARVSIDVDGTRVIVGHGKAVMDLRNINQFYEQWTLGDTPPGDVPIQFAYQVPTKNPAHTFQYSDTDKYFDQDRYLLYVHGWNMDAFDKDSYASTAYKRMWWNGYTGKIGMLRWPTACGSKDIIESLLDAQHYDRSEMAAWQTGDILATWLPVLSQRNHGAAIDLIGHSMGNVVVSNALLRIREQGQSAVVGTYIASQAAVPGRLFAPNGEGDGCRSWPAPLLGWNTPEVYKTGLLADIRNNLRVANFHNANDLALSRDISGLNQALKPDSGRGGYVGGPNGYDADEPIFRDRFFYHTGRHKDEIDTRSPEYVNIFLWSDGVVSQDALDTFVLSKFIPDGKYANTYSRYYTMAYLSESRNYPLGASFQMSMPRASSVDLQALWPIPDTKTLPTSESSTNDYSGHRWHSGQFRMTMPEQKAYWKKVIEACRGSVVNALP